MTKKSTTPLRRFAAEFAVIVLGVLVALWIDSSWAWFQDRQEESITIDDLRADFEQNLALLDGIIAVRGTQVVHNLRALEYGVEAIPSDSLAAYLVSALPVHTFNPRRGALTAALSSGGLNLIRDHETRSRLAGWEGFLEDAQEEIRALEQPNLRLVNSLTEEMRIYGLPILAGAPLDSAGIRRTLVRAYSDPELRSAITTQTLTMLQTEPEVAALRDETAAILSLLRP